jgi:predicted RNase H-like nuclease
MSILLIGFDSAWSRNNRGGLVAALREDDGRFLSLGDPTCADFSEAAEQANAWQQEFRPATTFIMLDQPTIVNNEHGQRKVESIVSSIIGFYKGGMQPANRRKSDLFGDAAPIWTFLRAFGGPAHPLEPVGTTHVFETYPALTLIALERLEEAGGGRRTLPKYNPENRKQFRSTTGEISLYG